MQLIPQEQKWRNIISKMEEVIRIKDTQLEELQRAHQCEKNNYINVSHLSVVSSPV